MTSKSAENFLPWLYCLLDRSGFGVYCGFGLRSWGGRRGNLWDGSLGAATTQDTAQSLDIFPNTLSAFSSIIDAGRGLRCGGTHGDGREVAKAVGNPDC